MSFTLSEIAAALGLEYVGNGDIPLDQLSEPADAGPNALALAMNEKLGTALTKGHARAAILWQGADWQSFSLEGAIFVTHAGAAMPGLTQLMDQGPDIAPGIHASAVISDSAQIGQGAAIGPFVVIGANVSLGENARIGAHTSIARGAHIGANCLLHAGVRIGANVHIGDNFISQPNACIGGDGFSYKITSGKSAVETLRAGVGTKSQAETDIKGSQHWARVYSLGNVVIGDDVEIGSNTSIDRGTIRATTIGRGTKIDNQVQIGHNCEIGEDCLICGASGIAGSVRIGDRVVLGGQTGVTDNLFIGNDVIAGAGTTIFTNVPAGRAIWGTPAVRMETQIAMNKETRRLPRLAKIIRELQKHLPKSTE